jgi:hypothetical protein
MSDGRAFASDLVSEKRQRKQNQKHASDDMTELVDQFKWEYLIVDKQKLPGSGIETPHTLPLCSPSSRIFLWGKVDDHRK